MSENSKKIHNYKTTYNDTNKTSNFHSKHHFRNNLRSKLEDASISTRSSSNASSYSDFWKIQSHTYSNSLIYIKGNANSFKRHRSNESSKLSKNLNKSSNKVMKDNKSEFVIPSLEKTIECLENAGNEDEDNKLWVNLLLLKDSNDKTIDIDRAWYDSEEGDYFNHGNENSILTDADLLHKEDHLKHRAYQLEDIQRKQKLNIKDSIKYAEQDLWELNRLNQSGINMSSVRTENNILHALYEIPSGTDIESNNSVHVIVREMKPPFLCGDIKYTTQIETVPIVKDPTSDLAILAKRGSQVVRILRDREDKSKMRQRFWEVAGSSMGELIGLKQKEKTKQDLEDEKLADDSNKEQSTFSSVFKQKNTNESVGDIAENESGTGVTDFSKKQSIQSQRECLPIYQVRDELLSILRHNQIMVIVGETGSGKTTQLTQYLYEEGYANSGIIGCTQPRRVAAVSVAKRVADEMNVNLGDLVGYAIRFEDCIDPVNTKIIYMTDGILLRESLLDNDLDKYSVIIMDEAHERSLNTDILFGILKNLVARRNDFRLIVTSATMNSEQFSNFFGSCPIFHIPGRTFPVQIVYTRSPANDYVDAAVQQCLQIHCSNLMPEFCAKTMGNLGNSVNFASLVSQNLLGNPAPGSATNLGDILIFMTGQEDIEATCHLITERAYKLADRIPPLTVLPIYSTLPADLQAKIFEKSSHRKVIVATNIAETSLTLDGVRYVIDCGFCKLKTYNAKVGMDALQITPISRANAQQRSGRAGRTGPGICYRLYTERAFVAELFENNIPEIQRTNLCHTVLLLKSLGIENLLDFDFMDPPPQETILNSMYQLWVLGALDNNGDLTEIGKKTIQFPLDPPLAKMLLTAANEKCTAEVLVIVSMLSVPSVFYRPKDRAEESDSVREKFFVPESDHLTLLNAYMQWKNQHYNPHWATAHFVHHRALIKARDVRLQLLEIMKQQSVPLISSTPNWDVVRKAICSGYFQNASKIKGIGEYVNLRTSIPCHLHPSSAIYGSGSTPEYIVYHEVVITVKEYMQTVTAVDPRWLAELGPMFFTLKEANVSLKTCQEQSKLQETFPNNKVDKKPTVTEIRNEEVDRLQSAVTLRVAEPGVRRKYIHKPLPIPSFKT